MEYIFGFVVFSVIVYALSWKMFPHTVTPTEVIVGVVLQGVIIGAIFFGAFYTTGHDWQILNGVVTSKERDRVSCEHSYSCNCRQTCSGSGKSRSCSQTCDTCYEHSHDYDWNVHSTVGSVTIDRIDRQGVDEPPRWTQAKVGEFFAKESSYFNYIKASPLTIFDKSALGSNVPIPEYLSVHDYYRINRVVDFGSEFRVNFSHINDLLNDALKTLGDKKKVNVVVVFHAQGDAFVEAYRAKSYGGKINDVVVLVNKNSVGETRDIDVFSWSKNDIVNIKIRDSILDVAEFDDVRFVKAITENIDKYYEPRSIEEFKYLEYNVDLPMWAVVSLFLFGLLFPFGWGYIAHKHLDF